MFHCELVFLRCIQSLIGIYSLDIVLYHTKNDFVIKKVLDVKKISYLSKHGL